MANIFLLNFIFGSVLVSGAVSLFLTYIQIVEPLFEPKLKEEKYEILFKEDTCIVKDKLPAEEKSTRKENVVMEQLDISPVWHLIYCLIHYLLYWVAQCNVVYQLWPAQQTNTLLSFLSC